MQIFHDYDPDNPFLVAGEKHIIENDKIRLNYTPMQGTVSISGFKENTAGTPAANEFYIDYQTGTQYRMATQYVKFGTGSNGKKIEVNYKGVSTLILSKHFNEIRDFMEKTREYKAGNGFVNLDTTNVNVVQANSNTLIVSSVAGLNVGAVYTIADKNYQEYVRVKSIDSATKTVTLENSITNSYTEPKLMRTTATFSNSVANGTGGIQKIQWEVNKTWKGEDSTSVVDADVPVSGAKLDNVKVNDDGTIELLPYGYANVYGIVSSLGTASPIYCEAKANSPIGWFNKVCVHEDGTPFNFPSIMWSDPWDKLTRNYLPRFYTKEKKIVGSDGTEKTLLLFSPYGLNGFKVHPAFVHDGKVAKGLIISDARTCDYLNIKDSDKGHVITFTEFCAMAIVEWLTRFIFNSITSDTWLADSTDSKCPLLKLGSNELVYDNANGCFKNATSEENYYWYNASIATSGTYPTISTAGYNSKFTINRTSNNANNNIVWAKWDDEQ